MAPARPLACRRPASAGQAGRLWTMLALCVVVPVQAGAAALDIQPSVGVGVLYESNPTGAVEGREEDDSWAITGDLRAEMTLETGSSRYSFEPQMRGALYPDTATVCGTDSCVEYDNLDYLDFFLPARAQWSSQRAQYRVDGGFNRTSTRNFPGVNPNTPTPPGSNIRLPALDEYQERWSLSPSASWQLTPRQSADVYLALEDIQFSEPDDVVTVNRFEYQTVSAGASWTRALTEQHRVSVGANVDAFFAESTGSKFENDTVSYGANLGYEYVWTAITSVGVTLGAAQSEITAKGLPFINTPIGLLPCLDPVKNQFVPCEIETDDQNFIGQLFFRQKSAETITTEVSVGRSIQPSSDGAQVTLDTARLYIAKEFGPRLSGSAGVVFSSQEAVGAGTVVEGGGVISRRFSREYWSVDASLYWQMSRTWSLRSGYSYYRDEQTEGVSYTVPRHRVTIDLVYRGLGSH